MIRETRRRPPAARPAQSAKPFAAALILLLAPALRASQVAPEAEGAQVAGAERIEELTQAILSRPEFQNSQAGAPGLWEVLHDFFTSLLRPVADSAASEVVAWLVLLLALGLAGWAVSLVLQETGGGDFFRILGGKRGRPGPWQALDGTAAGWDEAMSKTRAALAAGRVYEAVWIAHRAFLGLLDLRGTLSFAKWKTNRDYLTECPADDQACPLLRDLSQAYEEIVYGHRPFPPGRLEELLQLMEEEAGRNG